MATGTGFPPGTIDIEITGLTPAMDHDVSRASDGRFRCPSGIRLRMAYGSGEDGSGAVSAPDVTVYNPLDGPDPISHIGDTAEVSMTVPPGVFVLAITS